MSGSPQNFEERYQQLNPQQRQAVDTIEGVVMVLAGPGSGKTQILAMRIARILQDTQMDPYNILCLTFTESGVAAMRKRLISIIGPAAYQVRIHTFHSFCNDIIQEYPEKFSFARELEVLSDIERVQLFEDIINALPGNSPLKPFGNPYLFLPDLSRNVQALKAEHITSKEYAAIVAATKKLLKQLQAPFEAFITLPMAERTPGTAEQLHEAASALRDKFPHLSQHFDLFARHYQQLQEGLAAADNKRSAGKAVTLYKNKMKRWHEQQHQRLPKQQAMQAVYDLYQVKLKERGRYDYEDMILFVLDRFKSDDELLAHYQEQFQYILVDEYQDTNGAQNATVNLLGRWHENPNIFVVGDDKQSIYRFQGASLENLLFLYEQYKQFATVITLQQNYRSQQLILDAASAVIARNQESIDRYIPGTTQKLVAAQKYPSVPIAVNCFDTVDTEVYGVAKQIQALITSGVAPQEIAVLYRRNADAADFANALLKLQVPIQLENGHNILEDIVIEQLIALLQYVYNPQGDAPLWSILQYDFWQLSALDVIKSQQHAVKNKLDLFTVISTAEHVAAAGTAEPKKLLHVAQRIADWQSLAANRPLPDFVAHVVNESGLLQQALSTTEDHVTVLNCLTTFFNQIKHVSHRAPRTTLKEFLEHLKLLLAHGLTLPAAPLQTKRQAVRLMTAHKAKGLEFEHVFMVRMIDRHWGNLREKSYVPLPAGILHFDKIAGQENNEDERRLFYVALTRAKQQAYISYAARSNTNRELVPAVFITEIPAEYQQAATKTELDDEAHERLQALAIQVTPRQHDGQLEAYIRSLLDHYILSVTHLNNYLECPRLFYYRNLLRVPSVKTVHMAFGTAIHMALYEYYQFFARNEKPAIANAVQSFKHQLQREVLTAQELTDTLAVGEEVLQAYLTKYGKDCSRDNLLEYNFHSHGVHVEGIPLTGLVDKIEIIDRSRNEVRVVDYKTGNPDTKRAEVKAGGSYHRQLVFYKMLSQHSPRFPYTVTSGEIDFVQQSPTTNTYIKKQYELTDADVAALTQLIKKMWADIHALKFLAPDNPDFCGECEYCVLAAAGKLA